MRRLDTYPSNETTHDENKDVKRPLNSEPLQSALQDVLTNSAVRGAAEHFASRKPSVSEVLIPKIPTQGLIFKSFCSGLNYEGT